MILYLDSSAIVKRYIQEAGSSELNSLIVESQGIGTNIISRAEVAAGIMRATRLSILLGEDALRALRAFRLEWESYQRLGVNEATVARADDLVINYDLRGYDAVHLASAHLWQEAVGEAVTMVTFDQILQSAATETGLHVWPV